MQVGDRIEAEHDGERAIGIVTAVCDGRALVRLTIQSAQPWTSAITGGIVPADCLRTHLHLGPRQSGVDIAATTAGCVCRHPFGGPRSGYGLPRAFMRQWVAATGGRRRDLDQGPQLCALPPQAPDTGRPEAR